MARTYRSSRSNGFILPLSDRDATYRRMSHGPIVPLEKPTFLERLFGIR